MSDEEFAERVTAMTQTLYRVCYAQLSQAPGPAAPGGGPLPGEGLHPRGIHL